MHIRISYIFQQARISYFVYYAECRTLFIEGKVLDVDDALRLVDGGGTQSMSPLLSTTTLPKNSLIISDNPEFPHFCHFFYFRAAIDHRGKKRTPGQKIKIITSKHNFFKDWDLKKVEK
jgi:hypothetical protein